MYIADKWTDFEVLDAGSGRKLERWHDIVLLRPDPQAIWPEEHTHPAWAHVHAVYSRSDAGGGDWEFKRSLPKRWTVRYGDLQFYVKPMGFKHTGLFPEQAANWDWMRQCIAQSDTQPNILNLFAYTGGATVACAAQGARVTHVDAARGMVQWAGENMELNGLADAPVRYIIDDCLKFVQREARRGKRYDAILMDPPSYGRGPGGETWKLEDKLFELVQASLEILSATPLFFLINSYTTGLSATVLENLLKMTVAKRFGGHTQAAELGLPITPGDRILPCGTSGRWQR
ncbi:MAG: class I SAM-dependent methyltransferase [Eubacteriales bacterium]|nr:class I SAM-dependent methyltransferase [Eubacteriales bacterium]